MSIPYGRDFFTDDQQAEHDAELLDNVRSGAWLDAQTFPELTYAVPGIVPEGLTLLVGAPKAGKSLLALDLALYVAGSGPGVGKLHNSSPRPVLLLALEDGDRRMQDRCRALRPSRPIPELLDYVTAETDRTSILPLMAAWSRRHSRREPLIILDTLGRMMPEAKSGETPYARDYRVAGNLKSIADDVPGTAVLVLHHDRKAESSDFVDAVSGTHGIAGAADTITVLSRPRGQRDAILHVTGRDVSEAEYALTLTEEAGWRLEGATLDEAADVAALRKSTHGLGDRSAEVVAAVKNASDGITPSAVADAIGMDGKQVGVYLGRLLDAGRIAKLRRGVYGPTTPPVRTVGTVADDESTSNGHNTTNSRRRAA